MVMMTTPGQQELDKLQLQLNAQADTLTAILKLRTKRPGNLGDVYIAQFDPKAAHVKFGINPPGAAETEYIDLPLEPPAKSLYEVKARVWQWRHEALYHYKVPRYPKVDYYSRPGPFPAAVPAAVGLSVLFYALFGVDQYADWFRDQINMIFGVYMLPAATVFAALMHIVVEPVYLYMCMQKYGVPGPVQRKYLLTTAIFGYAGIGEFWDCVEYERIRHIYRQTDVGDIGPRIKPTAIETKKRQ